MKKNRNIETQKIQNISNFKKKQLSGGEIIFGSVIIDDNNNSSNNTTSIKQYISMINDEMNNLLKQSKLYLDVIELDTQSAITDNLKVIHERKLLNTTTLARTGDE